MHHRFRLSANSSHRRPAANCAVGWRHPAGDETSGVAWCHRLGQDLHRGQGHRAGAEAGAPIAAQQDTLAAQSYAEMREFLPTTPPSTSVYYDYYRPRRTSARTPTSRRDAVINGRSTACAWLRRVRSSAAATRGLSPRFRASTAWAATGLRTRRAAPERAMVRRNQLLRHLVEITTTATTTSRRGRFRH